MPTKIREHLKLVVPPPADGNIVSLDPVEVDFRVNSARTGAWVSVVVCIPALIYALAMPRAPGQRTIIVVTWLLALAAGVIAFFLPWRRIVRSRWRELAFLSWTGLDLLLIGFVAAHDGGPSSPFVALLFVPIVFVGAFYPTWSVNVISTIAVSGYVVLAAFYGETWPRAMLVLGGLTGVALMSWWQARNHEQRRRQLAEASVTDPLTGVLNRRGFNQAASSGLAALDRHGTPLALMIIDLDEFKNYNDTYGHQAGDDLLAWVAVQIQTTLRPMDSLARIGGDEFAVLLAGSDVPSAQRVAQRIRDACEARAPHCIGISSAPDCGRDLDALYRASDRALYAAKRHRASATRIASLAEDMALYGV